MIVRDADALTTNVKVRMKLNCGPVHIASGHLTSILPLLALSRNDHYQQKISTINATILRTLY